MRSSVAPGESYALEDSILHFLSSFFPPSSNLSGSVTAGALRVTVVTAETGGEARKDFLDVSHHVQGSQVESAGGGTLLLFISERYSSTDSNDSVF